MFDLTNCRFAFLDLETTGLSPWFGDRICEVGIVRTEGKRIRETYETLVNPGRELSPAAASTNGLTDAELASAPPFEAVADEVTAHLQDAVVVCHNAQFDLQFLDNEFRRIGREVQIPNLIDTLSIAHERFDLPSNALLSLAEAFRVPMDISHRALADALTDRGVFFGMMEAIQPPGGKLDEYIGIYNSPAWSKDSVQLPTELNEAIQSEKRLFITYLDGKGNRSERWVTPFQVIGLSDYLYLHAHCHLRNAERSFRLDRVIKIGIEV
ncbi:MAG: exonuclease domain-containing protein [Anaerolineales bacterium]